MFIYGIAYRGIAGFGVEGRRFSKRGAYGIEIPPRGKGRKRQVCADRGIAENGFVEEMYSSAETDFVRTSYVKTEEPFGVCNIERREFDSREVVSKEF